MTRTEFMKQLQVLLSDISENEREEALQYYHDYFDDAGPEEEARILRELGSPEQVARKIKAVCPTTLRSFPSRDTGIHVLLKMGLRLRLPLRLLPKALKKLLRKRNGICGRYSPSCFYA